VGGSWLLGSGEPVAVVRADTVAYMRALSGRDDDVALELISGQQAVHDAQCSVVFKLWGQDTGGALSIVEHPFAVGALVEPHLHTREDEDSIVTEGEIGFRSGDREVVLGAGGYITKPRGELHAMWNAGTVPTRMIEIISPAGLEHLFRWLADLVEVGLPPLAQVAALAARYGVEFGDPEWLPDIIDRYQLIPPMP
jgi:mannose-6-phosphate isomerase-like protein (cupin superfamily)